MINLLLGVGCGLATASFFVFSYVNIYCFLLVICNSHINIGICDQLSVMLISYSER